MTPQGEDLHELIDLYLSGRASDEQVDILNERMRSDEAARELYVEMADTHARLSVDEDLVAPTVETDASAARSMRPPLSRSSSQIGKFVAIAGWLTAAAAMVVMCLPSDPGEGNVGGNRPSASDLPIPLAARITHQISAVWNADAEAYTTGDGVENKWLRLASGIVQVEFGSGAQLALQGPAELRVDSDMDCFLQSGRLTVLAPPEAMQFTVKSPTGNVIDLGTEFGIVVDANGQMEVHVLDGEVEVEVGDQQKRTLVEHQAATVDPATKQIKDTAIDRESFEPIRHETLLASKPLRLQFDCGVRAGVYHGSESPAHATGDVPPHEVYWNGMIGDQSGRFVLADGSASQLTLDVEYAHEQLVPGSGWTFSWDAGPQLFGPGHCVTRGVFDTELGKDSLRGRGVSGLRIKGLPVGKYRIYFIARSVDDHKKRGNYLVLKAFRVAVGADLHGIPKDAAVIMPLDDPNAANWVAGQTHHVSEVEMSATDEYLTLLVRRDAKLSPQRAGGGSPIVGVQIVQID